MRSPLLCPATLCYHPSLLKMCGETMFHSRFLLAALFTFLPGELIAAEPGLERTSKDGAPMVLVPAGVFPMGVPPGDRDGGRDEYPRHDVFIDPFYIDKYEVTNGRYLEFVRASG